KIESIPQVRSSAITTHVPLDGSSWTMGVRFSVPVATEDTWSKVTWVGPQYFKTLGTALVSGREFTERDNIEGSPRVAIVNETFVRKYFPNRDPIGVTLTTIAEPGYPEGSY